LGAGAAAGSGVPWAVATRTWGSAIAGGSPATPDAESVINAEKIVIRKNTQHAFRRRIPPPADSK
jgi:hypothetical protein